MFISSLALLMAGLSVYTNGVQVQLGSQDGENGTRYISCSNVGDQYVELHLRYMPNRCKNTSSYFAGGLYISYDDDDLDSSIDFLNAYSDNISSSSLTYNYGYQVPSDFYTNVSCSFRLEFSGYSNPVYYYSQNYSLYYANQNSFINDTLISNTTWYNLLGGDNVNHIVDMYFQFRILDSYTWSMFENNMGNDYQNGYSDGYNNGYNNGKNDGYTLGYQAGKEEWYQKGIDLGHDIGYREGLEDGTNNNYGFPSLFYSIADTPVLMIQRLFNFDLFGMNVLTVVLSLFTAILLIHIAKKIIK